MTLELKIGEVELRDLHKTFKTTEWKFLITKSEDSLMLYASQSPLNGGLGHRHVKDKYNLSKVLGGGELNHSYGKFLINGLSGDYGIVPNQVMEQFGNLLIPKFDEKYGIKSAKVNMHFSPEQLRDPTQQVQKWLDLGYTFDNDERILK